MANQVSKVAGDIVDPKALCSLLDLGKCIPDHVNLMDLKVNLVTGFLLTS